MDVSGVENSLNEVDCRSEIYLAASNQDLISKWHTLATLLTDIDIHIFNLLQEKSELIGFSKWGIYLPEKYKVKLLKDKYFDIEQTSAILATTKLIENK